MSVLVTGGGGYIGSHMVWHLIDAGEDVVVLDDFSTGFEWAVAPEARIVQGDCGDQALVGRLIEEHRVEAIIHFAGSLLVGESVAKPLAYYLNNTVKSRALIETAVAGGVKHFVFSSTAAVYGTPESFPVSEDAPLRPESPYGRSKLMTEMMLADTAAAARPPLCGAPLFQRRRRRPARQDGAIDHGIRPISSRSPARPRSGSARA